MKKYFSASCSPAKAPKVFESTSCRAATRCFVFKCASCGATTRRFVFKSASCSATTPCFQNFWASCSGATPTFQNFWASCSIATPRSENFWPSRRTRRATGGGRPPFSLLFWFILMLSISLLSALFQKRLGKEAMSTLDKQQFTYRGPTLCATLSNTANAHL